jgi:hypothetical protein
MWLVRHTPLQHDFAPQKLFVRGPQSATVTQTCAPVHWWRTFMTEPHPRRGMYSPHRSGRVIFQQAWEAFGQAPLYWLDWQVPQAPVPVLPHGPHPPPQQNQVHFPRHRYVDPHATSSSPRLTTGLCAETTVALGPL